MRNNLFVNLAFQAFLLCSSTEFVFAANEPVSAKIELCTGNVTILKHDNKSPEHMDTLMPRDTVQTSEQQDSRCRIIFTNGQVIHAGAGTIFTIDNDQQLTLQNGQLLVLALPTISQASQVIKINVGTGVLALTMGKVSISILNGKPQIALFDDLVAAAWHDQYGDTILNPGSLIKPSLGSLNITQTPRMMQTSVSEQTSPELPAVKLAIQAFKNKELKTAKKLFKQIQQAFPYNAAAAYYLGVLELNENHVAATVEQWQRYIEIDPEGAQKSGVTQQLTLISTRAFQTEIKHAITQERTLSQLPPEPNSIAVNPLINQGEEQYRAIGKGLTAFIITDLAKIPGLKVLEREKLQMLNDEIKLSEKNGLVDKSSQVRTGRMLRAEKILVGDYLIERDQVQP